MPVRAPWKTATLAAALALALGADRPAALAEPAPPSVQQRDLTLERLDRAVAAGDHWEVLKIGDALRAFDAAPPPELFYREAVAARALGLFERSDDAAKAYLNTAGEAGAYFKQAQALLRDNEQDAEESAEARARADAAAEADKRRTVMNAMRPDIEAMYRFRSKWSSGSAPCDIQAVISSNLQHVAGCLFKLKARSVAYFATDPNRPLEMHDVPEQTIDLTAADISADRSWLYIRNDSQVLQTRANSASADFQCEPGPPARIVGRESAVYADAREIERIVFNCGDFCGEMTGALGRLKAACSELPAN